LNRYYLLSATTSITLFCATTSITLIYFGRLPMSLSQFAVELIEPGLPQEELKFLLFSTLTVPKVEPNRYLIVKQPC